VRFTHTVTCSCSVFSLLALQDSPVCIESYDQLHFHVHFSTFQTFHFISLPNVLSSISQKPLSRIIGLKGTCILNFGRCYQTSPKWVTISIHSSSEWEFIFSPAISIFSYFNNLLWFLLFQRRIKCTFPYLLSLDIFFCNISFQGFSPLSFSVGLSVSSFRGSLCILHIPDISLLLDICFLGLLVLLCLSVLSWLCWLGVSCDRQAFHCI